MLMRCPVVPPNVTEPFWPGVVMLRLLCEPHEPYATTGSAGTFQTVT